MKLKSVFLIGILCSLYSCTDPATDIKPDSNTWGQVGAYWEYYAESCLGFGGYSYAPNSRQVLTGNGTINVEIIKASGSTNVEFGLEYHDPDIWGQTICYRIRTDGWYEIGWIDDDGSLGVSAPYETAGMLYCASLNTGLNCSNILSISYNTNTKSFIFYINGIQVLSETYDYISDGYFEYYCEIPNDASSDNPYEFKYRTTSPYSHPF